MATSFSSAFAAARKAGKKEFTWNGKRYNTKLAKTGTPAKMKAPASKPARLPESVRVPGSRPGIKSSAEKTSSIKEGVRRASQKSGASRSTKGKVEPTGLDAQPKLTIGQRIKRSIAVGKTAVDRKHRREDAEKANKGVGDAVKKMLKGMGTRPKKKK